MTRKYPAPTKGVSVLGTAAGAAVFGAVVGGTAAAAKSIRKVREGKSTREEAVVEVAREAGSTAVAAGTATAVTTGLGLGPFLSLLGIAVAATGVKYALDSLLKPEEPATAPVSIADGKAAAAKKTAPQKSTPKKAATQKTVAKKKAAPASDAETEIKADKA